MKQYRLQLGLKKIHYDTNAGLTVEQGMEACKILQEISMWMGSFANVKIQAISIQEARELLVGLQWLQKESFEEGSP